MLKLIPPRKGHSPYWTVRGTYLGRKIDKTTKCLTKDTAEIVLRNLKEQISAGDGLTWRTIPGFSRYEISDNGQIRRLPAILKQTLRPSGHMSVTIYSDDGKAWRAGVHQLVARAFKGNPPPDKPYACHKNGVPSENNSENLYWGSPADNAQDAARHAVMVRRVESVESRRRRGVRTKKYVYGQSLTETSP